MSRIRGPQDDAARISALERRVNALEKTNLQATAAIPNPSGAGDYVMATQLAYGLAAATVSTAETITGTAWADPATVGPSVSVAVGPSGRALVLALATVGPELTLPVLFMGVAVDGVDPASWPTPLVDQFVSFSSAGSTQPPGRLSVADVVTGLTAGSHTFTMRYLQSVSPTHTGNAFSNRTLVVWPF